MRYFENNDCCFLLAPGWRNSGPEHWQTLWEKKLPHACRVQQEDWEDPVAHRWVETIHRAVRASKRPVVLVAHSLGCHAVAGYIKGNANRVGVRAALLVAPPAFHFSSPCSHIVERFERCRQRLSIPSLLVGSDNDPYASAEAAEDLAKSWGSRFVNAGRVGHINVESGHGPWPEGEELLSWLVENSRPEAKKESHAPTCSRYVSREG